MFVFVAVISSRSHLYFFVKVSFSRTTTVTLSGPIVSQIYGGRMTVHECQCSFCSSILFRLMELKANSRFHSFITYE